MASRIFLAVLIASALFAPACSTTVDSTNPYDPAAPESIQAKGEVKGSITLERGGDLSGVTVALQGTSGTAQTDADGKFSIKDVREGVYVLAAAKDGYRDLKVQGVQVAIGKTSDVGSLLLYVGRGLVRGQVSLSGASDSGGATVTLKPAAKPATLKAAALDEGTDAASFAAISAVDGRWEVSQVPVGWYYLLVSKDGFETTCSDLVNIVKDGEEKTGYAIELVATSAVISFSDSSGIPLKPYSSGGATTYYTGARSLKAVFNASGVTQYRTAWSEAGLESAEWEQFAVQKDIAMDQAEQDGAKSFWVEMKDQCRLTRKRTQSLVLDTQPPNVAQMSVDGTAGAGGGKYTRNQSGQVTVRLHAEDALSGVEGYRISVDKEFTDEPYVPVPSTESIVIGLGSVEKRYDVRAQFVDRAGNASGVVTDPVSLDLKGPTGTLAVAGISEGGGEKWVTSTQFDLVLTWSDPPGTDGKPGSGVSRMKVWNDGDSEPPEWREPAQFVRWNIAEGDGQKGVRLKLADAVGNEGSQEISESFKLYTKGPVSGIVQLEGASDWSGVAVSLSGTSLTAITGQSGAFTIADVPQGVRDITFTKTSYKTTVLRSIEIPAKTGADLGTLRILLAKGSVYGKALLDGAGSSSGIVIALAPGSYAGYTDADGNYRIDGVPVGTYTLTASREGYATQTVTGVLITEDGQLEKNVPSLQKISAEFTILDPSADNPHNTTYAKTTAVTLVAVAPSGYAKVCAAMSGDYQTLCVPEELSNPNYKLWSDYQNFTLPTGEGSKEVQARWLDASGKSLALMAGNTTLDTLAPVIDTVLLNSGAKYINNDSYSSNVTMSMASHDETSGVYQYRYLFKDQSYHDWATVAGAVTVPWEPTGDGEKKVTVRFRDMAGNETSLTDPAATASITVNTSRPTGTKIDITPGYTDGSGKKYVKSSTVTITLTKNGAVGLKLSNDSSLDYADYRNISTVDSVSWELTPGDGSKKVYARFYNEAGNYTNTEVSDTVELDTTPPQAPKVDIQEAPLTSKGTVNLKLGATGASHYAARTDTAFTDADWKTYTAVPPAPQTDTIDLTTGDGLKTVYARFKDNLGNETQLVMATVELDQTAPSNGSIKINKKPTNVQGVEVTLFAIGATKMCLFGDIQTACNPATPVSGWEPYNTAKTVNLTECTPPGNCQASRDVKVAFADNAGNKVGEVLATEIKDTVALDQIPPSATSVVIKGYVKDTSGADTESQTLTYKSEVKLVLGATGATKVALSNTPIGSCAGASYSDATFSGTPPKYTVDSYLLQSGTGNKTVYACFKDDAGNSAGPATAFIYLDQNGPFNVSLGINRGAVYTSSTGVQLDSIAAQDDYQGGQIYMMISNCPDFGSATGCNTTVWLNLASNYPPTGYWALNNGTNESKRVYLKTRDAAGNESATASSSIILDTAKPSDLSIAIKQKPTKNTQVDLVIGATGADRMCLYGNMQSPCDPASKPETWERFRGDKVITLTGGEGTKTIYLVCADDAGNKTDYLPNNTVYDQTTYDITPPNNPQLQINSGNPYTLNQQVTLTMSADGSPYEYWVEGDVMSSAMSAGAFAWLPYTPSAQVNLQTVPARREIRVKYRDAAGNESYPAVAQITYDPTGPQTGGVTVAAFGSYSGSAGYTTTAEVDLGLSASDDLSGVAYMQFSRCSGFDYSGGVPYSCNYFSSCTASECCTVQCPYGAGGRYRLKNGTVQEEKQVFARFQNWAQYYDTPSQWTAGVMGNIILDTFTPLVDALTVTEPANLFTKDGIVTLTLLAHDQDPGNMQRFMVKEAIFAESPPGFDSYPWEAYSGVQDLTTPSAMTKKFFLSSGEGVKTIKAKVRDYAGLTSPEATRTVTLDRTPAGVTSLGASAYVKSNTLVPFSIQALDNYSAYQNLKACKKFNSGGDCLSICNKDCTTADWEAYPQSGNTLRWDLPSTEMQHAVHLCTCDQAGNITFNAIMTQVFYDKTKPNTPSLAAPVAGSSTVTLNWNTVTDQATADGPGSGIDHYKVQYDPTGAFSDCGGGGSPKCRESSTADASTTLAIEDLQLHTNYSFRVIAYDKAGNPSDPSSVRTAVTGWKKTKLTPKPFYHVYTSPGDFKPYYMNGRLWIPAKGSDYTINLYNCDPGSVDCGDAANWDNLSLGGAGVVLQYEALQMAFAGGVIFLGSTAGLNPTIWTCNALKNDCTGASNWQYMTLPNPGSTIGNNYYLNLTSNGNMIAAIWGNQYASAREGLVLSVCYTADTDCLAVDGSRVALYWSAPITLPNADDYRTTQQPYQPAAFADDKALWIFYRDKEGAMSMTKCGVLLAFGTPNHSGCTKTEDFSVYGGGQWFRMDYLGGTDEWTGKNIVVSVESESRHVTWERYRKSLTDGKPYYERMLASCNNYNCGMKSQWVIGGEITSNKDPDPTKQTPLLSTAYSMPADMAMFGNQLRLVMRDPGEARLYEMSCGNAMWFCDPWPPMTCPNSCGMAANWTGRTAVDSGFTDGRPMTSFWGPNPIMAIRDDTDFIRVFQPKIPGPPEFSAGPAVSASSAYGMGASWLPVPPIGGYSLYYGPSYSQVMDNRVSIPDPAVSSSPVDLSDSQDYYSLVEPFLGGETGERTPVYQMKPFLSYTVPYNPYKSDLGAVMCMNANPSRIAAAVGTPGGGYVGYCNFGADLGASCKDGGNWTWKQFSASTAIKSCSVALDSDRIVVSAWTGPYRSVFMCDGLSSGYNRCSAGMWAGYVPPDAETDAKPVLGSGIISIMYMTASDRYHVKMCDMKIAAGVCGPASATLPNCCTMGGYWTDVDIDTSIPAHRADLTADEEYDMTNLYNYGAGDDGALLTAHTGPNGVRSCYCHVNGNPLSCGSTGAWTCGWAVRKNGLEIYQVRAAAGNTGTYLPTIIYRENVGSRLYVTYCTEQEALCFGASGTGGGYWITVPIAAVSNPGNGMISPDKYDISAFMGRYFTTYMNRGTLYLAGASRGQNTLFDSSRWDKIPLLFNNTLLGPSHSGGMTRLVHYSSLGEAAVHTMYAYVDPATGNVVVKILLRGMMTRYK